MSTFVTEEIFNEIKKTIGRQNAYLLTGHYTWLHVPTPETLTKNPDHPLAEFLGIEDAIALAEAFPSFLLTFPKMHDLVISARNTAIEEMYTNELKWLGRHKRIEAVATAFNMTIQNVHNILGIKVNKKAEQLGMF